MSLDDLERNWDALAGTDPMWAILNDRRKRGNRWGEDEFFLTGVESIQDVIGYVRPLAPELQTARALDFGCGIGRLTQPLASYFNHVDGVDVAPSMIERARELNARGAACTFWHNPSSDLGLFDDGTFDFVFTEIVLQHMPRELMFGYIAEFARVLRPGGVAAFDVPGRLKWTPRAIGLRLIPPPMIRVLRRRSHGAGTMDLYLTGRNEVLAFLEGLAGVEVLGDRPLRRLDPGVKRHQFVIRKIRESS